MMNDNVEKLADLAEDLRNLCHEHADILGKESTIAHPLHEAKDEACRRFRNVSEAHAPKEN